MYLRLERSDIRKKVLSCGLKNDPNAIEDRLKESLDDISDVHWSDSTLFMVSTPSPHTKENLKVKVK